MHPRINIRNKIKELIENNILGAKTVSIHRLRNIETSPNPHFSVDTYRETSEIYSQTKITYRRNVQIAITIALANGKNTDDDLDNLAQQVENILILNDDLDGICDSLTLTETSVELDLGNQTIGGLAMNFDCVYYTDHVQEFDDLETVNFKLKHGDQSDVHSETQITIPTE